MATDMYLTDTSLLSSTEYNDTSFARAPVIPQNVMECPTPSSRPRRIDRPITGKEPALA